jgi:alpha-glucosidase (family GH31 glycosyl hydrolase)
MRQRFHLPWFLTFSLAFGNGLLLLAAQPQVPGPELLGGKLVLRSAQAQAQIALTREGLLRITVIADGFNPALPPVTLDCLEGGPLHAVAGSLDAEAGGYRISPSGPASVTVTPKGLRPYRLSLENSGSHLVLRIVAEGATAFHGFGQAVKALGVKDENLELYHAPHFGDQTYLHMPFFFSDSGLAVAFNAAGRDQVHVAKGSEVRLSTTTGRLDLYLWNEADPAALVARWYRLSGSQSLLPRWAYGYLQSRYGYRTDAEVRHTVDLFKRFKLPLSAIILDLYWFKRMGDLAWNREAFPDPEGLATWLHNKGVKLVTISEPFFNQDSLAFPELQAAGVLAKDAQGQTVIWKDWWDFGKGGGGGVIDPLAPKAAVLLGGRYTKLAAGGVDGFWIDLGEPERVPAEARFGPYDERAFHNAFNLAWAKLVRKAFLAAHPARRPFILSRSGYIGIAGLGVSTWSGDVPANWKGLRDQIPLGLSASLSGLPFWGSDVGGFITRGGEAMPPDPELYLRWQQFGAFTPVYRAHGTGPREPWIYGEDWMARVKAVLDRRQLLLPYIYSTAYQVWSEGRPMLRPLFFLDPTDPALRTDASAYLLGDAILIAPVTQPLEREAVKRVRLPKGAWYDAFTLERHAGGSDVAVPLSLDRFPLFYREGAIIPVDAGAGEEGLILLPGPTTTTFTVFSDDGETEAYRRGAGEQLRVALDDQGVNFSGVTRERAVMLLLPRSLKLAQPLTEGGADPLFQRLRVKLKAGAQHVAFTNLPAH